MLVESLWDHRIERDTGQWLPIAESAEAVNQACVAGQGSGGMEETGKVRRMDSIAHKLTKAPRRQQETIDISIRARIAPRPEYRRCSQTRGADHDAEDKERGRSK